MAEQILQELSRMNREYIEQMNEKFRHAIVSPQEIQMVMEQWRRRATNICVAGRYNVGKSTLINALLGSDILPTSVDAETAATVYITMHRPENVESPPHLYSWPASRRPICSGADAIRSYLRKRNSQLRDNFGANQREFLVNTTIRAFSEFPDLREGITPYLVDLPGSNEAGQRILADVAELNVKTAMAFLYVMTYNGIRNEQDFQAIRDIYNGDRQIFDDRRLIIVVTHYDIAFESLDPSELTEEDVQRNVVMMISRRLGLVRQPSREIVIPISGRWAFWARLYQSSGRSDHNEPIIRALLSLSRSASMEKIHELFTLSAEEKYFRMERASRILLLEQRLREVTRSLIRNWKGDIATKCESLLDTAMTEVQRMQKETNDLYELHQQILRTKQKGSVVLRDLRKCYDADTKPGVKLRRRIDDLVSTFMQQVRSNIKRTNYLPQELERDVRDGFHYKAEKGMQAFFRQEKFYGCNQELQRAILKMDHSSISLMKSGANFVTKTWERRQNTSKECDVEKSLDYVLDRSNIRLKQLHVPQVETSTFGKLIRLVFSFLTLKFKKFRFIRDEHLEELELNLRGDLEKFYTEHFGQIKEQVVQCFFKIYCQKTTHNLVAFDHLMIGVDIESLKRKHEETLASLSQGRARLRRWRR